MRSIGVAYILWFFFGVLGVHRFYCNRIGTGILWFLTGGLAGIGWLVDIFLIPDMVDQVNFERLALQAGSLHRPKRQRRAAPVAMAGLRVIYCTHCGGPMQVPQQSAGRQFACPVCRTILISPA